MGHSTLQGFQAKFNTPQNGPYQSFHVALDSLILDVLKKAAESRRAARLNSDDEQEDAEGAASASGSGSRGEGAVARPQAPLHQERQVRIIFIATSDADEGQARQLPWVMHGNEMPNKSWLAILCYCTWQELGEAACRYLEAEEYPW